MKSVSEADWVAYRDLVPVARERYTGRQNDRLKQMLSDDSKTQTERFWDSQDFFRKEAKILQICLDHHARSAVVENLANMLTLHMITGSDLSAFSEETTTRVHSLAEIFTDASKGRKGTEVSES